MGLYCIVNPAHPVYGHTIVLDDRDTGIYRSLKAAKRDLISLAERFGNPALFVAELHQVVTAEDLAAEGAVLCPGCGWEGLLPEEDCGLCGDFVES